MCCEIRVNRTFMFPFPPIEDSSDIFNLILARIGRFGLLYFHFSFCASVASDPSYKRHLFWCMDQKKRLKRQWGVKIIIVHFKLKGRTLKRWKPMGKLSREMEFFGKISDFQSRWPRRDITFYPNKMGQKLTEIWGVQYNSIKKWYLSVFGWAEKPSKVCY